MGTKPDLYFKLTDYYPKGCYSVGNLLFQIAAAISYTKSRNIDLAIITNSIIKLEDLPNSIFKEIAYLFVDIYPNDLPNMQSISVTDNIFNYEINYQMVISGFFRNSANFKDIKPELLNLFRPYVDDIAYILDKYPIIKSDSVCTIHIRRGEDYVNNYSYEYIKQLESYYFEMMDYIIAKKGINNFIVLTNDREYCSNILDNNSKYSNINFTYTNELAHIDMWIMSMTQNNIMSCSSLSWWGSYLNECDDKFIISHNKINNIYNSDVNYL